MLGEWSVTNSIIAILIVLGITNAITIYTLYERVQVLSKRITKTQLKADTVSYDLERIKRRNPHLDIGN